MVLGLRVCTGSLEPYREQHLQQQGCTAVLRPRDRQSAKHCTAPRSCTADGTADSTACTCWGLGGAARAGGRAPGAVRDEPPRTVTGNGAGPGWKPSARSSAPPPLSGDAFERCESI